MPITTVETEDGRTLEVLLPEDRSGLPLLFHNGLPSAVVPYQPFDDTAAACGLHVISYSRPGYGGSSPWPEGREPRIVDDVADTRAVLNHLGIDEFVTTGWSGGGPRALATAALMPDRCLAAASLAGVAPVGEGGMDVDAWLAGMGPENVRDFEAARQGRAALEPIMAAEVAEFAAVTGADIVAAFGELVSDVDAASLTGEFADYVAADFRRSAAQGVAGILEDTLMIVRDWGFDVTAIERPVAVWQGRHDRMVPYDHGAWLAGRVPGARAHLFEDEGHLSLVVGRLGEILADLRELGGR